VEVVNSDDAEQSVLSCCYQSPLAFERASAILTGADFYNPNHEALWGVLKTLKADGLPTDAMAVQSALSGQAKLMTAHLAATLNPSLPDTVEFHANVVRGFSARRSMLRELTWLRQRAEDMSTNPQFLINEATNRFAAMRNTGTEDIGTLTLGELMEKPEDPFDWVIPQLLERMDRLILTGEEGLGKSVFLRQLALMAAAGIHPFTGRSIPPIKAHIIDLENTERHVKRQLKAMWVQSKMRGSDPSARLFIDCDPRGIDITRDKDLSWVNRVLDATQPDLLIIGPLYRMVPRALQTDDHVAPVIAALNSIRARGITLAMEAHAGHAKSKNDERDMRPRGSSALMGWPEFGYGLRRNEIDVDLVAWRGDRDEREWPKRIRPGGLWPWTAVNPQASDQEWEASFHDREGA
jgi:hypothetical protein